MQRNNSSSWYQDEEEEGIEVDINLEIYSDALKLSPKQVRALAKNVEFCKELPSTVTAAPAVVDAPNGVWSKLTSVIRPLSPKKNHNPPVILSFLVRDPTAEQEADLVARIHIYCNTGTVGVCRIQNDQVREMFFRNCSLKRVEKILKKPPPLRNVRLVETFLNELNLPPPSSSSSSFSRNSNVYSDGDSSVDDSTWVTTWIDEQEDQDLRNDIELLDVAISILQGEKEDLESHVRYLIQGKVDDDGSNDGEEDTGGGGGIGGVGGRRRKLDKDDVAPTDFSFSLPSKTMHMVDTWLEESAHRGDFLTCVTTNGPTTLLVLSSGTYHATSNLPSTLRDILETKGKTARLKYASLGTNQRFFVSFSDGECNWIGPKSLDILLKDSNISRKVISLAFGQNNSTYFVVYEDGSWDHGGQGIPAGLIAKLNQRKNLQDLSCVSLGPDGEAWFLKAKNGRMWWGGVSKEMDDAYNAAIQKKKKLKFVSFGEDGSYFMTFIKE